MLICAWHNIDKQLKLKMLFHIFIAIAVFFLKTEAKTLFVIDIGYQTPDVTLGQKIAVLSCQVNGFTNSEL